MKLIKLEAVLMDNGEIISKGKTLGFVKDLQNSIVEEKSAFDTDDEWKEYDPETD